MRRSDGGGVWVEGVIGDRAGAGGWTGSSGEQVRCYVAKRRGLGGYLCGRRLYQTMMPWETDP